MPNFSLRGIDENISQTLKTKAASLGISVNALILNYINIGLGVSPNRRTKHHDLDRLAGTWTNAETDEFLSVTNDFEKIDPELWK